MTRRGIGGIRGNLGAPRACRGPFGGVREYQGV